jgi:hypothetical protein
MERPQLGRELDASEFLRWYWLKVELQAFCRSLQLLTSGSKTDLTNRIVNVLSDREVSGSVHKRTYSKSMPSQFTSETVIGAGWRCTRSLRDYFISVHGAGFTFNAVLREIIASGQGMTLAEASAMYVSSRGRPTEKISGQFEYNRHMREYHACNPGSSHSQAVNAWWENRSKPIRHGEALV